MCDASVLVTLIVTLLVVCIVVHHALVPLVVLVDEVCAYSHVQLL
jgi:hypothetical protein